jgi:hypothetical protein
LAARGKRAESRGEILLHGEVLSFVRAGIASIQYSPNDPQLESLTDNLEGSVSGPQYPAIEYGTYSYLTNVYRRIAILVIIWTENKVNDQREAS